MSACVAITSLSHRRLVTIASAPAGNSRHGVSTVTRLRHDDLTSLVAYDRPRWRIDSLVFLELHIHPTMNANGHADRRAINRINGRQLFVHELLCRRNLSCRRQKCRPHQFLRCRVLNTKPRHEQCQHQHCSTLVELRRTSLNATSVRQYFLGVNHR